MVIRKCDVCHTEVEEFCNGGRYYFPGKYADAEVCEPCNHRLHDIKQELEQEMKELYEQKLDLALEKIRERTPRRRVKSNLQVSGLSSGEKLGY